MECLEFAIQRVNGPLAVFAFPPFSGHDPRQALIRLPQILRQGAEAPRRGSGYYTSRTALLSVSRLRGRVHRALHFL